MPDERDPRSLHIQVAAEIRARIMEGSYSGTLPKTDELMAEYGVAQGTIGRAQTLLREEGLLHTQRGRHAATYVIDWAARVVDAEAYIGVGDGLTYSEPEVEEVDAPADVARLLGDNRALVRRRTTLVNDAPIELSASYFPVELARVAGLDTPRRIRGGAQRLLAECDMPQREFEDVVSARQPTSAELLALELPEGVPVLRILRKIVTDDDRVVGVDVIVKGAHRYSERYRKRVA